MISIKKLVLGSMLFASANALDFNLDTLDIFGSSSSSEVSSYKAEESISRTMNKALLQEKIQDTDFKIIDAKKYNELTKYKEKFGGVNISAKVDNTVSVNYVLELNKWYYVRNKDGILSFKEYLLTNKELFNQNNLYFKLEETGLKILSKSGIKYAPVRANIGEKVKMTVMSEKMVPTDYVINFEGVLNEK